MKKIKVYYTQLINYDKVQLLDCLEYFSGNNNSAIKYIFTIPYL